MIIKFESQLTRLIVTVTVVASSCSQVPHRSNIINAGSAVSALPTLPRRGMLRDTWANDCPLSALAVPADESLPLTGGGARYCKDSRHATAKATNHDRATVALQCCSSSRLILPRAIHARGGLLVRKVKPVWNRPLAGLRRLDAGLLRVRVLRSEAPECDR
jgi:hypothetical protein